jgi:hypothetical protein
LILGFLALRQIKQTGQRGRRMAIAGIVIGGLVIALVIALRILSPVFRQSPG